MFCQGLRIVSQVFQGDNKLSFLQTYQLLMRLLFLAPTFLHSQLKPRNWSFNSFSPKRMECSVKYTTLQKSYYVLFKTPWKQSKDRKQEIHRDYNPKKKYKKISLDFTIKINGIYGFSFNFNPNFLDFHFSVI